MTPRRPTGRGDAVVPLSVAAGGLLLAAYLLLSTGVPPDPVQPSRDASCVDRVVHLRARLSDC